MRRMQGLSTAQLVCITFVFRGHGGLRPRCIRRHDSCLVQAHNAEGAPRYFLNFNNRSTQSYFARRYWKGRWQIRDETLNDRFHRASENRIYWATHPGIAQESGASGKNLLVRRLNMSVCANHCRNLAIEK